MRLTIILIALLIPVSSAAAQQAGTEPGGTGMIRVTGPSPYTGLQWHAFQHPFGTTAPLAIGADPRIAPLPVLQMEPDTGRTWSVTGAVVGAVTGAAVGAALGCLANRDDYGVFCGGQSDTKVVVGTVLGAGAGAWIGAVLPGRIR